ncbi:MAG: hypothetical protein WA030_02160 [Candidatus Microsaccharimonas sp.]
MDIVEGELNHHANYNGWTQHELEAAQDYLRALHSDPNAAPPPIKVLSTNKASVVTTLMDRYAGVS